MRQPKSLDKAQQAALEAEQLATIQQPALVTTCAKVFQTLQGVNSPQPLRAATVPTALDGKLDAVLSTLDCPLLLQQHQQQMPAFIAWLLPSSLSAQHPIMIKPPTINEANPQPWSWRLQR